MAPPPRRGDRLARRRGAGGWHGASLLVAPTLLWGNPVRTGEGSCGEAAATPHKTTVNKTTVSKTTKLKSTMSTTPALPKTGDSYWIAASLTLFQLGTVLLSAAYRC